MVNHFKKSKVEHKTWVGKPNLLTEIATFNPANATQKQRRQLKAAHINYDSERLYGIVKLNKKLDGIKNLD